MIALCREKKFKITEGDPGEYKIEYDLKKSTARDQSVLTIV
jgi:hypothetical protein